MVDVGHSFGKVSVLATMSGNFYLRNFEQTSNADRLKFNGPLVPIYMDLIGPSIVAFVRSLLGNFRKTQKLQTVQTHKTQLQKVSWHTGYNPSVSTCGPAFNPQHWHLFLKVFNAGVVTFITLLSTAFVACISDLKRVPR